MNFGKRKEKKEPDNFPRYQKESSYSLYKLISATGLLIIICLLVVIGAQHLRQGQAEQELLEYKARIDKLEQRREENLKEIERLQDLDYIEIQARNRLGLVKPEDRIFQIED